MGRFLSFTANRFYGVVLRNAPSESQAVAMAGLGANQPEHPICPFNLVNADGKPLVWESR